MLNDPRLKYIHPELPDMWDQRTNYLLSRTEEEWATERRAFARRLEIVGDLNEAGALILAGTDMPSPYLYPGFSLHGELEVLVEAGLTPLEALQAATLNAAVFLEATDSLGTIEVGKAADLVLLDANPLADIRNTQRIQAVILRGEVYARAELDELLALAEAAAQPSDSAKQ
ncbi:MAG: amidohydrolase family protein [Gemmatimonadota bacterium]